LYTDGSKLDNGKVGAGWAIYRIENGINQLVLNSYCFLGFYMEVYDAELHAVHEALQSLDRLDIPTTQVFICIDNLSAIQTLADNKDNSEPAKMATQLAHSLKQKGWDIRTAWTPSHIKIMGNEKADEMAKLGTKGELDPCEHAYATKAWWYTESRKRYLGNWRMELGIKHSPGRYSEEHRKMTFEQARALYRCFATAHQLIAYLRKNQNNVHADRNHCQHDISSNRATY
jgi:ribonuclease HI